MIIGFVVLSKLVLVTTTTGAGPAGKVEAKILDSTNETGLRVELNLTGVDSEQAITSIALPRSLADSLQASPPDGFKDEPLVPEPREEKDDEAMRFINDWNRENLQWVGTYSLKPDTPQIMVIPMRNPTGGTGDLSFSYGSQGRFGGVRAGFTVTLPSNEADQ